MPKTGAIELVGIRKVNNDLRAIRDRMASREELMAAEIEVLELAEKSLFETLGGMYVRTGDLKASLTDSSAKGAIRQINPNGIVFGTSIWYAKFQRSIDGPSGKPRGRKRYGPNKVLRFTPLERRMAAERVMDFIMERVR